MADMTLTPTRLRAGLWEGVLTGAGAAPELRASHLGQNLPGLRIAPIPDLPGSWKVEFPVPPDVLSEGVQTIVVSDSSGRTLAHVTVIAGVTVDDDIRAEIGLLRAELDMLKRNFRQHCIGELKT